MDRLTELRSTIDRASIAYYRTGKAIMTDAAYDLLIRELRGLAPTDERLSRVGPPIDESVGIKAKHAIPMGSLDNTDDGIAGLADWYNSMVVKLDDSPELSLSLKIDGSSAAASYEDGKLVRVITRGNGTIGEDITANARAFQGLPSVLPISITCTVRGEVVLHKADFDKLVQDEPEGYVSNPRNVGNGIIGREDGENCHLLNFYAFNLVVHSNGVIHKGDFASPSTEYRKLETLEKLGFQTVPHYLCSTVGEIKSKHDTILVTRDTLPYHIDGLVVVLDKIFYQDKFITADTKSQLRPKFARAIKFPAYTAITTVTGVVVTVGHNRVIVPTLAVAPVRIGAGITVDSVIVTNYDEIKRQDVAIGDTVEVFLAGDIVPNLGRVIQQGLNRQPILEPDHCPACGGATSRENRGKEGANVYCTNPDCDAAKIRKIGHWCGTSKKGIGILDIGDSMIQALWDADLVHDPADLYTLEPQDIQDVVMSSGTRIGLSRAETICKNIYSKSELPLAIFLGALGIDLLGTRRAQLLIDAAGGKLNTLGQWRDRQNVLSLECPGLQGSSATRTAIVDGMANCSALIDKLLSVGVTVLPATPISTESEVTSATEGNWKATELLLANLSFCFTGTRECIADVQAQGGAIHDNVRKGTTYLVYKPTKTGAVTNKAAKAEKLGTKVITLDHLKEVLAGTTAL